VGHSLVALTSKRWEFLATNENVELRSLLLDPLRLLSCSPRDMLCASPLSLSFLSRLRDPDSTLKISEIANWSNWSSVRQALFSQAQNPGILLRIPYFRDFEAVSVVELFRRLMEATTTTHYRQELTETCPARERRRKEEREKRSNTSFTSA